jgi:hypothetical protein
MITKTHAKKRTRPTMASSFLVAPDRALDAFNHPFAYLTA